MFDRMNKNMQLFDGFKISWIMNIWYGMDLLSYWSLGNDSPNINIVSKGMQISHSARQKPDKQTKKQTEESPGF